MSKQFPYKTNIDRVITDVEGNPISSGNPLPVSIEGDNGDGGKQGTLAYSRTNLPAKNLVKNGMFKDGKNHWGARKNVTDFSVDKGTATFTGAGTPLKTVSNWVNPTGFEPDTSHIYYVSSFAKHNGKKGKFYIGVGYDYGTFQVTEEFKKYSHVGNSHTNSTPCFGAEEGLNVSFSKAIVIDLTETFGSGNEPTADQMDELLYQYEDGWFDGTQNLFDAKSFMAMYFDKIKQLENAITENGGDI